MKTFFIYLSLTFIGFQSQFSMNEKFILAITQENSASLDQIEKRIYDAIVEGTIKSDVTPMEKIENVLKQINLKNQQNLVWYWRSYLNYYKAIYYLKMSNNEKAEDTCDEAVNWLTELENKTSEDYALLVLIESFGIQFKGAEAMFISSKIKKNA